MNSTDIDPLSLASLLASRLCHDLVNPVGALSAGLEVLEEESDPVMVTEARKLINMSTRKSIAMLAYARLAFGAGGAYGEMVELGEARKVAEDYYEYLKADLVWNLPASMAPKNYCKAVLDLAMMIGDCVPRAGSSVTIEGDVGEVRLVAAGPRAKLKEPLVAALSGDARDLEPKMTPALMAAIIARQAGGEVVARVDHEEQVSITATFPQYAEA